ncbi:hypothetical protein SteCoe_1003 [Stentor coeruleus]|uniref:EF-hand domain-containing protein n=1 Tax=Stentor coeruleus TaxID=5963 RepID=A0A1R2D2T4_9CILI|nr:hypothetical protein SteCoe_1003 [Stentor coeruleus]
MFDWSDIDADGFVSRTDLKHASGLSNDEEVEAVFRSLKESAGGNPDDLYLAYDEFCKGIMDFPFLLDQFKQESFLEVLPEENPEADLSKSDGIRDSSIGFVTVKLKEAITLYYKGLKSEQIDVDTDNKEDLLEILREGLKQLRGKYKQDKTSIIDIINGSIEMYLIVRDLSSFHEEVVSDLQSELYEVKISLSSMTKKHDKLKETNERLLYNLANLENKAKIRSQENCDVIEEKKILERKLEHAEQKETDFLSYMGQIETVILDKEKAIASMEKQLRQLNSLKTLQEMRGTTAGRTTEEMRMHKLSVIKARQSVPVNNNSPQRSHKPQQASPNNDIKIQIITNQLKKKNQEIELKAHELDEMEFESKKYYNEICQLKEENNRLRERFQCLQFEILNKKNEERESLLLPSLYDELQLVAEGSTFEHLQKSALYQNYIITKPTSGGPELKEATTQTNEIHKPMKSEKNRGCFSCF